VSVLYEASAQSEKASSTRNAGYARVGTGMARVYWDEAYNGWGLLPHVHANINIMQTE
jgi:hypothetical protein